MVIHSPTVGIAGETGFELQYVPEFSTKTELGEYVQGEENKGGVERRNLKAFGLAVVGVGVGSWVVWKGLRGLVMGVVGMGRGLLWLWG